MQLALIAPKPMLGWTRSGDLHFIIPPTADPSFYRNIGEYKIIDNGVYETGRPVEIDILLSLARDCKADEIIVPDVLFNEKETVRNAKRFYEHYLYQQFRTMIVPQAPNPEEWIRAYTYMTDQFGEADTVGVPKWLDGKFNCRSAIIRYLQRKGKMDSRPHHFLGVDSLADIMNAPCVIRSCDTSKPFTFALHDIMLTPWSQEKLKRVRFDQYIMNRQLILINIQTMMEVAHWNDST